MSSLIVSKFGGFSLANAERVRTTADIIKSDPSRRYVVISAPGSRSGDNTRITDLLYICHARYSNKEDFMEILKLIEERYRAIIDGLGMDFNLEPEIADIKKSLFFGKNNEHIVSRGEYIMAKIMSAYMGWEFVDASRMIFFNRDGTLNEERTFAAVSDTLKGKERAVIPGFYGTIPGGDIKTFARGGGDTTGAIIARAVKADLYEKWAEATDVFSADPTIVKDPEIVRNITYAELRELTYMGIKIVYEDVTLLLKDTGIPIRVHNIHHPDDIGTLITDELPEGIKRDVAACIAGRRNYKVIRIEKFGLNKTYGVGEKVWGIFARHGISCEHYISGIYNFAIVVKSPMFDLKRAEIVREIQNAINPESVTVERDLSLIAIIGKGMGTVKGMFARVFDAIAARNIKVRMINQGADDLNIILGVYDEDFDETVRALYDAMIMK